VFHVFVFGSAEEKIKRVQSRHPAIQDAQKKLQEIDRLRAAYIRTYHHRQWDDRHLYDLMINSDAGIDLAVSAILCAAGLSRQEKP
jgi:cytidylate kinase